MGVIYKITNLINGKSYIGQTNDFSRRIKEHFSKNTGYALNCAIKKYGKDAFKAEIIEECSKEQLDSREIFWIDFYKTHISQNGYNMTFGGDNADALDRWRDNNPEQVKKYALKNLEAANRWNEEHPKQALQNILNAQKIAAEKTSKKVKCIELDLIFDSLSAAEEWSKSSDNPNQKVAYHQHISKVCKGQRNTTGGYHWKYV